MKIPFAKPDITKEDVEAVKNVLENQDRLTDGLQCRKFESDFYRYIKGVTDPTTILISNALATSSCMAALHLSYMTLGIGPGDEVLCPSLSHAATAHAIEMVGARPIFVDSNGGDGNIDARNLEKYITKNTKAITLVHFLGKSCNMKVIMEFADNFGLYVVEDCALGLGSKFNNQHVGTFGDCSAFSFYPAKHITTGEGGMFVTKDAELFERAQDIMTFGKEGFGHDYDIVRLGSNFRMDEMSAALGRSQLKRIDKNLEIRRWNYLKYERELENNSFCSGDIEQHGAYAFRFQAGTDRFHYMNRLENANIGYSIYYPHPINRLSYYRKKYGWRKKVYPNAIKVADESLCLPAGQHITSEKIEYIIKVIND